jgi:NAD(P)H dehydrogenase (quinone)
MRGVAGEFSNALGRTITYVNIRLEQWRDQELRGRKLPDHLFENS